MADAESKKSTPPKLLSGGNPQIPKGDGEAPVQAYIDAMPEWKSEVGRRIDDLVGANVEGVQRAVRWNSPFYGVDGHGWILSFHCFTNYVKVTFFNGAALDPEPPIRGKDENARMVHISADDEIDEELFADWLRQASSLPGWKTG